MALQSEKSKNKPPIENDGWQNILKQRACQQKVIKTSTMAQNRLILKYILSVDF
jgi:hypothetical protein